LDEVHDQLEALGTTVVGVRNLLLRKLWSIVEEQPHLGCHAFAQPLDTTPVLLIHDQDVIEPPAVLRCKAPRPLGTYVDSPAGRTLLRPLVWRLAKIVRVCPTGVRLDLPLEPFASDYLLENTLRNRRAADVSKAHEKHPYHEYQNIAI